ncbi:hypothetical protein MPL3356_390241 [Mesorhizobium plurifarium]|uniref:Uncharacterized protein n=1 Tax=Mesorhizobium plurifarium TaxID=69974 RepID=A0A090DYY6_MESPL|nr:hypothetical protein MPL3356_390241 [Mesorhizobium plurifarium]
MEVLKFLVDVLGPLNQRLEIHHGTSLTRAPRVLNELLIYLFTFRSGSLCERKQN